MFEKLPKMHRYGIPIWNRHWRPGYIDEIGFDDQHLFLQLLQEGMNLWRAEEGPPIDSSCFLQIRPWTFDSGRIGWDLYLVSLLSIEESEGVNTLLHAFTERPLDDFVSEGDWLRRLKENL